MKGVFWLVLAMLAGALMCKTADSAQWGTTETPIAVTTTAAATPTAVPEAKTGLTFKQRRAMGLTVKNVRTILAAKQAAGELEGRTTEDIAAEVLADLVDQNPKAFADPAIDWDAILAFIEKLIPLILKIIALFGV